MLKETKSDFSLDHILDAIYHEEDNDDMMKVVAMFDRGGDATELENVLELVSDAWNYFPHKLLGGLSPAEKVLEYNIKNKFMAHITHYICEGECRGVADKPGTCQAPECSKSGKPLIICRCKDGHKKESSKKEKTEK